MYSCLAKDKSGNLVCNRKFDDEEFNITQDKERCLLHCDKHNWHNEEETIFGKLEVCDEIRYKLFSDKFVSTFSSENKSLRVLGVHFPFNPIISTDALSEIIISEFLEEIIISDCKFYGEQSFLLNQQENFELKKFKMFNIDSSSVINFNSCNIKNLNITGSNIKSLGIYFSNFDNLTIAGHFSINDYRKIENIDIVASNVKKDCWIYEIDLNYLRLHSVNFSKTTLEKLHIKENLELDKSKFEERLDFFDVEYLSKLNLEKTLLPDNSNFLQLTANKKTKSPVKILNRETARKLKNSFEHQNNIIEANKFYALEMKAREKELEKELKQGNSILEWLVFKVHGISSNHSQNWEYALFWIIIISLFYSYGFDFLGKEDEYINILYMNYQESWLCSFKENKELFSFAKLSLWILSPFLIVFFILNYSDKFLFILVGFSLMVFYMYLTQDYTLSIVSNNINLFSIITEKGKLGLAELIYRITIAFLIYQFIVSIRQNTRRK